MAKGSSYEREICKKLSEWWSRTGADDIFWRTHGSGARATSRSKRGKSLGKQYGDICAVDTRGKSLIDVCTISCKRGYAKTTIGDLIDQTANSKESQFAKWISEAIRDHLLADSLSWMLIVKRDRKADLIFMSYYLYNELRIAGCTGLKKCKPQCSFIWDMRVDPEHHKDLLQHILRHAVVWGTTLENFLDEVSRNEIVALAKKHRKNLAEWGKNEKLSQKYMNSLKRRREKKKIKRRQKKIKTFSL